MPISVFLSTVTDEFRAYRDQLRADLTRHNVAVKVQEAEAQMLPRSLTSIGNIPSPRSATCVIARVAPPVASSRISDR